MCDKDVWEGVHLNSLSNNQRKSIITSSVFLKDKYTADGKFDKLKSRLVAGGHLQDRNIYDYGSSPTVSTTSVFIVAAIAAVVVPGPRSRSYRIVLRYTTHRTLQSVVSS